ncbi:metal-dependent hydrolase [Halalkalibacter alkalisediminis]|uniref:Metal-dependent hydrolase n=1 Tax=Halalkalibacter alkalisediminis TaxID=935616 RepID=A0ABV6NGY7_9BACI|nr:metal-dependent hydrolase [Halalkalibacter alkalisediminis]
MKGTTHIIGGIAAAVVWHKFTNTPIQEPIYYYSAAFIGSIIPDICHPKSMIGRRLPILSRIFSKIFGHRSLSHSLLFMMLLYILFQQLTFIGSTSLGLGVLVGVASHILLDSMTTQGVKFLYPFKMNVRMPLYVRTGSLIGENFVTLSLLVLTFLFLFT